MTNTRTGSVTIDAKTGLLAITDVIRVPIKTAWTLLTNRRHVTAWWGDHVDIELRPGGKFEELWSDPEGRRSRAFGTVREVSAPFTLLLDWKEDDWPYTTTVALRLRDLGTATEITVTHNGWPIPASSAVRDTMARHYYAWKTALARLKAHAVQTHGAEPSIAPAARGY